MIPTFVLLGLAILAVWLPSFQISNRRVAPWPLLFAAALISGLVFGFLTPAAVVALALFAACVHFAGDASPPGWKRNIAIGLTCILALALAMHVLPGFRNPLIADGLRFSSDAAPYKQFLNFDKAAVGLLLVALFCRRSSARAQWKDMFSLTWPIALATLSTALLVACLLGYVRFDVKLPAYAPVFLATNLLFTCVAEEAFFRGFLQEKIGQSLERFRYGAVAAIGVSGVLFGLVHMGGGLPLVLLSTLVGLGSAYAYARTRRIEAAIFTHYAVNAVHFVFFTYPFLK